MASQTNVLSTHKANILTNGRTFQVSLSSTAASTAFDGSDNISDIGVEGTLAVTNGGTGIATSSYKNAIITGSVTAATNPFSVVRTGSGAFYATAQDGAAKFGTLPVPQGGTGITTASYKNAIITGNSTTANSPFTTVRTGSGAFYSTTADGAATFGTLPVPQGGTGFTTTSYKNAIVAGNSTTANSTLSTIRTGSGALFSTTQDGAASFGTLPVPQGGTGQTSFTKDCAILSGSTTTAALTTRAITNNTSATAVAASTNLITANTLYYHKGNSNIVTVGTIGSGTWQGTTVGVGYGGTGKASWTKGGIVYASATNTLTQIADGTADKVLKCSGSATYSWLAYTSSNTASTLVLRDSSGGFSAGALTFAGGTTSGNLTWKSSSIDASKANNNVSSTQYPTTFNITDSADRIMTRLEAIIQSDGIIKGYWYIRNYNTAGTQMAQKGITMSMDKAGNLTYNISDNANFRSAIEVLRYINSTDVTTWTADTLAATDSLAFMRGSVTGAHTTGHIVFLNVKTIGTPFQLAVHDSTELYIWKRYWISGNSAYSAWTKMNAGYADTAGSASSCTGLSAKATADADGNTISSTYLKKSGGTMTGALTFANNTLNNVGDDCAMGDQNVAGALNIKGLNGNTNLRFIQYNGTAAGTITWNGTSFSMTGMLNVAGIQVPEATTSNWVYGVQWYNTNHTASYKPHIAHHSTGGSAGTGSITIIPFATNTSPWGGTEGVYISSSNFKFNNVEVVRNSGSWGISVTGSAGSVAWANVSGRPTIDKTTVIYQISRGANFDPIQSGYFAGMSTSTGITGDWWHILSMDWTGNDANNWISQLALPTQNRTGVYYRSRHSSSTYAWKKLWTSGESITNAVWNDYAECRIADTQEPGRVLMEVGDDTLTPTNKRMSHFAGVSSDTWGFLQGETDVAKTPLAVAGRTLVYPYRNRNEYKPGDCVCAAPNGTVDLMTREEIIKYPDRIVGIVSCVPEYEEWGGSDANIEDRPPIKVNGRIWIKVR